jgi:hypothetical protein
MSDETESQPDDTEPTLERQAQLRAAYEANVAAGKAPYKGVVIGTRSVLDWVMRERQWSGELFLADGYDRPNLSHANLALANLSHANLIRTNLTGTNLNFADLSGATLIRTNLTGATLYGANLTGATLYGANLTGADLRAARMDATTNLMGAQLDSRTLFADTVWNGVPVTRLTWKNVDTLGDEYIARQANDEDGKRKDKAAHLRDYQDVVMVYRQVATLLRSQGLNEYADRFGYRAQVLQREVLWRQNHWLRYLGALILDTISGHGYRPGRSILTYFAVVIGFAAGYYLLGQGAPLQLTPREALITSIVSFHGRGFFPGSFNLANPILNLVAVEAMFGLFIEITFIATFTQRFFAR